MNEMLENAGWKFENFATFVELIGLKTPIKLSDLDKETDSFKCVTALNTEVTIFLRFGDPVDFYTEIWVTEGEETRAYRIIRKSTVPTVALLERTITRNGKKLCNYYCKHFCDRTLTLDETHELKLLIRDPNGGSYNGPDAAVLRNCQQIEEYLLGLDNSLVKEQVHDRVMELLGFSDEDISNGKIQISLKYYLRKRKNF